MKKEKVNSPYYNIASNVGVIVLFFFTLFSFGNHVYAMDATPSSYVSLDDNITLTKTLGGVIFCTYDEQTETETNANNGDRDLLVSQMTSTLGHQIVVIEASSDPGCNGFTDLNDARSDASYLGEVIITYTSPEDPPDVPGDVNTDPFTGIVSTLYNASIWGSFLGLLLVFFGKKT